MADTGYRGYLICIKSNGESGSRFPIAVDSCYIGANAECEVRLLDTDCNDRHCLIKFLPNKHAIVICLCSEKPVLLNDKPIDENGSPLKNGDIIQIIDVKFKWEENDAFVDTELGRFSLNIENISEDVERKRFSEPAHIMNGKNLIEDEREDEPYFNKNNINANEKKDETKVTSKTTPLTKSFTSSAAKPAISSCSRSNYSRDSHNQSENNSSRDASQIRRSRQFCQTYKTKSIANTPDKKKTTPVTKSFFKNTPLQENNRTLGREVKSRFFVNRNSSIKPATPLPVIETSEKMTVQQNENVDSNLVGNVDNLEKEIENFVPRDAADIELKENTLGNETNAVEATFETTVPSDTVDARSDLATPRCFTKAFHSTPKAADLSESKLASNLEASETTNISDAIYGPDDPTKIYNLDNNSILASPVKSAPESNVFCKKRMESDASRMEPDSLSETRRHHTRSTSNILKKTFEECSEDNLPVGEKSLTTPEKTTNECNSHSRNPALVDEELELDGYSPEKKVDSRKSACGSIRSPILESTSELSAENGDAVSSLSLEVRDKSQKRDDSSMMAKCSRNLSSFSPPENNRSQEYMDSVVSTPKKPCLVDDEVSLSATTVSTPTKDFAVDGTACLSTPKTPSSPTRHRRSTGIVPCVGTPSDVYRTTKGGLTPAHRSRFNRTSMEVEVSMGPRDSLSYSAPSRLAPKRSSSERKSTPLKSDKSVARDSLQMHSPIVEEYDLENEESQNESLNSDSQFQFVSKRRRRLAKSSFAIEERILEESEIISSDHSNEDEIIDEESLEPMESFDDTVELASTRIVVNRTASNDTENDLDSTYNLDSLEEAVDESRLGSTPPAIKPNLPKSILTPLPRHATAITREKSTKKVTFCNLKDDSLNVDSSACSMTDIDSEYDLQLSSRVNSSADVSCSRENTSLPENESEDERLYLSDKSSDAYSLNGSRESSGSIVQQILAKRNKPVKRLSGASKGKSPRLSGVRRLLNPPKSPKCDYMDVSGVKQLMKTPESLVKPVRKHSLKASETVILKTPEPSEEIKKTPESRAKSSKAIASRQKTPASFGKRAKTTEALAECLHTPKALMELAKPPKIVVEFVETPKKADVSVILPKNEVGDSTSGAQKYSQAFNGDTTFATPTTRRCSKHFRIHRSSICMLAASLNSTLNETLSPHDCSASLENSIVEQNAENAETEIMPPPQNPEAAFKIVLVELKEKLRTLQERRDNAEEELLENSITMIDEVLVDEPVPDSDADVAERKLQNVLLELEKRFSCSEKSNENYERAVETEVCKFATQVIDNKEQSVSSLSNGEGNTVVAAPSEASKDSLIDRDIADASLSGAVPILLEDLTKSQELSSCVADSSESDRVSINISCMKNSEKIHGSVSDAVEEILSNVCSGATSGVSPNILSASSREEARSNISVASHSDKNTSCAADFGDVVNEASDGIGSKDARTSVSLSTSSVQIDSQNSLCTESESDVVLSATDDLSKSGDVYHSIVEFEESAFVQKETTVEAIDEEPQDDAPISQPFELQVTQNSSSISHTTEAKKQPPFEKSVPNVDVRQQPKHTVRTEEQETDSENLELFVSDSDELVSLEPKSTTGEKFNSEKTISNVTEATQAVENTPDSFLATSRNNLSENYVEKMKKSTIPANNSLAVERVQQKSSCLDNSAVSNDTFKTCSPLSNLTLTVAEVEEGEKTPKILDTIIAHERSQQFLNVSASLLVHEENKENLLSLTPIAASTKEKSILQETEKTPAPSAALECTVPESLLLTLVANTPEVAKSLDSTISADDDAGETIGTSEKNVIAPVKLSSAEKDLNISLNSSYPTDMDLDTTREENLSCIEPSMTETETVSMPETSPNVTEESRMTVSSCAADEERTTDASSKTLSSSQTSNDSSFDAPASSEACSTAQPSEVSSSVSDYAAVAPLAANPPDSNALMVTPRRCTAVCVSIDSQDQLTLAGPKIVTQTVKNSAKSISTSTPIFSDVTQKTMEIPQSCSTTIDPTISSSEDEAADLSSESSETVIDDDKEHADSSASTDVDESQSKGETILEKVQSELVSDASAVSQLVERACDETSATEVEKESQNDSASISVSQEVLSAVASKESVQENGTDGVSDVDADDEVTAPSNTIEEVEAPVKRLSRNFSVVLQDAKADLSPAKTDSIQHEGTGKDVTVEKSVADHEVESTRPKRGRPIKRYTDRSKGEKSTQSNKRIKNTANAATSNVWNVSVELERFELPQEEEPAKASQRKIVHFNIEPAVKRSTRPRELGKLYVPTPSRRRTESLSGDSDASPTESTVDQFGSPCSIVLRKIASADASSTTAALPKRASRSRSVAPKESARIRPARAASLAPSSGGVVAQPKRKTRANKVERILPVEDLTVEESQLNGAAVEDVAPKSKNTSRANKSVAKNGKKTEIKPPKEGKRSKRKAADEVIENADVAGSSTSGSKGKSKNESSKAVEVTVKGDVVETKTKKEATKSKKNASSTKDEKEPANAKSQSKVPAKEEKPSKRKVAEDVQADKKNENAKGSKRKGAEKNEVSETIESKPSSRATRQTKVQSEATEPPRTAKAAKVDLSTKTTSSRATRSRKDAVETSESGEKSSKSTKSKVASERSKSKATKRTATVVLDPVDEVVSKKRRQSPDPGPAPTRATRSKKTEVAIVSSELTVSLKRAKLNEKENEPKPVAAAAAKRKRDPTPAENVRVTRATKVKEAPQKENSVGAVAAATTRVTRSRNVSTLPVSRRAKK